MVGPHRFSINVVGLCCIHPERHRYKGLLIENVKLLLGSELNGKINN